MKKITFLTTLLLIVLFINSSASPQGANNQVGALDVKCSKVVITKLRNGAIQAMFALDIKNTSSEQLRLALIKPASMQLEDGTSFTDSGLTVTGLKAYKNKQECERYSDELNIISPNQKITVSFSMWTNVERLSGSVATGRRGRLSTNLFVMNQGTGKTWINTLSLDEIPVERRI
jgi:hypothetical protein